MNSYIKNKIYNIKKEKEKNPKNRNLYIFNEYEHSNSEEKKDSKAKLENINNIIKEYKYDIKKEIELKQKIFILQQEIYSINNKDSNLKNKLKIRDLKNQLLNYIDSFEQISAKNDKNYEKLNKNELIDDINKNQINLMNDNRKINVENIDMKIKILKMKIYFNNTKLYIKDLEEQLQLREIIIMKNNELYSKEKENPFLNILNEEQISKYKHLEQILKKNITNNNKEDIIPKYQNIPQIPSI